MKEPIIGTSANISLKKSAVSSKEVLNIFKNKISFVVDGGVSTLKTPSTIVNLVGEIKILREGKISKEEVEEILNKKVL